MADNDAEPDAEPRASGDDFRNWFTTKLSNKFGSLFNEMKNAYKAAEPDADQSEVDTELRDWFKAKLFGSFEPQFCHGSQPEEKEDKKTPKKKRVYKPRSTPEQRALQKEHEKYKLKQQDTKKKMRKIQYTAQAKRILARMDKERTSLNKVFKMLERNGIQIDESQEKEWKELSSKIDDMKNHFNEITEQVAKQKQLMDQEFKKFSRKLEKAKNDFNEIKEQRADQKTSMEEKIKKWERKEERERNKMTESIENNSKLLHETKEKAELEIQAAKQREKDEVDKINREIQKYKDKEDKVTTECKNVVEAKNNELAKIRDQVEENIKRMEEETANTVVEIDATILKLNDDAKKHEEEIVRNIAAKRKDYEEIKRKNERKLKTLKIAKSEYEDKIQEQTEEKRKIDAKIKYYEEKKVREEKEMKKTFDIMRKKKQKYVECIQDVTKKVICIEAELKTLQEKENLMKSNLDELAATKTKLEKNLQAMERQADAMRNEINQNMKQKEKEIEKNITGREKLLEVETESEERNVTIQQHEVQQAIVTNTETMDAAEPETVEQISNFIKAKNNTGSGLKQTQLDTERADFENSSEMRTGLAMDEEELKTCLETALQPMTNSLESEVVKETAESDEEIKAITCELLQIFGKNATKDSSGRLLKRTELDTEKIVMPTGVAMNEEELETCLETVPQNKAEKINENRSDNKRLSGVKLGKKNNIEKHIEALHGRKLSSDEVLRRRISTAPYNRAQPRKLHFPRPSTSSDNIPTTDLSDQETHLPSDTATNAASSSRPSFWQRFSSQD